MEDACKSREQADPASAHRHVRVARYRNVSGMQGQSLSAHAQYDIASTLGLFQPVSIAGGGMLWKRRGDYSIHLRNLQPQRRRRLLTSYIPSPKVSLWEPERELRLSIDQKRSQLGRQSLWISEWSQVTNPRIKH